MNFFEVRFFHWSKNFGSLHPSVITGTWINRCRGRNGVSGACPLLAPQSPVWALTGGLLGKRLLGWEKRFSTDPFPPLESGFVECSKFLVGFRGTFRSSALFNEVGLSGGFSRVASG